MYPIELFVFLAAVDIAIVFGLLWNINVSTQIYVKVFGAMFGSTLSYLLAQGILDGSAVIYWVNGTTLTRESVTSLSFHYMFLGIMVLQTLLFFVFVIGYFKNVIEGAISER